MKIIENGSQQLEVVDTQWLLPGVFLVVGVFSAFDGAKDLIQGVAIWSSIYKFFVGILFITSALRFARRSVFSFDLLGRQLKWESITLFESRERTVPMEQIKSAFVEAQPGQAWMIRLALELSNEALPLTPAFASYQKASCERARDSINRALGVGNISDFSLPPRSL